MDTENDRESIVRIGLLPAQIELDTAQRASFIGVAPAEFFKKHRLLGALSATHFKPPGRAWRLDARKESWKHDSVKPELYLEQERGC